MVPFLTVVLFAFLCSNIIFAQQNSRLEIGGSRELNKANNERYILDLINGQRAKYSLGSLRWNSSLSDLARSYSKKMARERFFSHYDNDGKSLAERASEMKITKWRLIGENLFMCEGYDQFAQLAVKGWMKSPGHRQNILENRFNETGIGIAKSRDGTIYITQVFMAK